MSAEPVLSDVDQATPAWLTHVLGRSGVLDRGAVTAVDLDSRPTSQAGMARLAVRYSPDAPQSAPRSLRLKLAHSGQAAPALPSAEVAFFQHVAPRMPGFPTPRCIDAAGSEDGVRWHLLLEDVSDTHEQPPYPVPPTDLQCYSAVETLARLHATWWEHPDLTRIAADARIRVRTVAELDAVVERTERAVAAFVDFLGDRLSPARRGVFERLLAHRATLHRCQLSRPRTVAHGDSHWWNFLYPLGDSDGGAGTGAQPVLVIDWAHWTVGGALEDLAHAIALMWFPDRRQRLERPLLEHYHALLCALGVSGYSWEDCWHDYRLFAATRPFMLAFQWQRKGVPLVWWNNLERAMLAFEDLRCAELLEP